MIPENRFDKVTAYKAGTASDKDMHDNTNCGKLVKINCLTAMALLFSYGNVTVVFWHQFLLFK